MFKRLLKTIFVLLIIAGVYINSLPEDFKVVRSAAFSAPAAKVFEQINNLHNWDAWSPWAKLDPNATNSFEGPEAGVGAKMSWSGNYEVGQGSMEITESVPSEKIIMKLDFIKPMKATNTTQFDIKEIDGKTSVTWAMEGKNNFIGKAMGLIFNCEKMVGGQFEKGLENIKSIVEVSSEEK